MPLFRAIAVEYLGRFGEHCVARELIREIHERRGAFMLYFCARYETIDG